MILLRKKVGGTPVGALSMPKWLLFPGSKVIPSDEPERRISLRDPERIVILSGAKDLSYFVGVGYHANVPSSSGYNLPSQLEGASRMTKDTGSIQRSTCDA